MLCFLFYQQTCYTLTHHQTISKTEHRLNAQLHISGMKSNT